ncbi:unnamed protein product [Gordionus sp. m RMFG-2023]|uniref:beta-1,3-galactosyltransferase 6-like n=1 Tax=Gordionus sp. m RMFG-2023 TaxID=3053472 RepID=UPI0030DE772F
MKKSILSSLINENAMYGDLVLLPDISDAYNIISQKLLDMIKWSYDNIEFNYFIKVDDDSFVKLDILANDLISKYHNKNIYMGYFVGNAKVYKSGKWAENSWFLCDRYLPYARGGGYVISFFIAQYLANNYHLLKVYNNEDTSLGVWTAPLDIIRIHDTRFNTEYISRGCYEDYVIMHKQNVEDMQKMYDMYKSSGNICEKESATMDIYEYNWTVLPFNCCKKKPKSILL